MSEQQMLYYLIAFILGWMVSKHMGNGFSVGCQLSQGDLGGLRQQPPAGKVGPRHSAAQARHPAAQTNPRRSNPEKHMVDGKEFYAARFPIPETLVDPRRINPEKHMGD